MTVRVQGPNPDCAASFSLSVEAFGRRGRCGRSETRLVVSASMDGDGARA